MRMLSALCSELPKKTALTHALGRFVHLEITQTFRLGLCLCLGIFNLFLAYKEFGQQFVDRSHT